MENSSEISAVSAFATDLAKEFQIFRESGSNKIGLKRKGEEEEEKHLKCVFKLS